MQSYFKYRILVFLTAAIALAGCKKIFDLPEERDYLSPRINYTNKVLEPILGRTTLFNGIFNADRSNFPMKFEIVNPRFGDGRSAKDMLELRPTLVWKQEYTGLEKTLEEIEAKRAVEDHPILEIRPSGDLIFWYTGNSSVLTPRDSILLPQQIRYFDVKVTNTGGTRLISDLQVVPWRERPYSPDADRNPFSGMPNTTTPGGKVPVRMFPTVSGMIGVGTNTNLETNGGARGTVYTYIRKVSGGNGHSLRFKFLDKDSVAIDPRRFNETKWATLVHGFNMQMTKEYVQYDVAYPIPLAAIPTRYTVGGVTGSGTDAAVEFSYSRTGFGNLREIGRLSQSFRIYEKGDWEIVFHFKTVNPKFDNE